MVWGNCTRCLMFVGAFCWVSFVYVCLPWILWHDFYLVSIWSCCITLTFAWPEDDMNPLETQKLSMSYTKCNKHQTPVILLDTLLCFRSEIFSSHLGRNPTRIVHSILCGWNNNYLQLWNIPGLWMPASELQPTHFPAVSLPPHSLVPYILLHAVLALPDGLYFLKHDFLL